MKLSFLFSLLLLTLNSFSQNKVLPMDEHGKYTFLEITELKSVPKDIMSANAKRFFKTNSKTIKLKSAQKDTAFYGTGKMIIQKGIAGIGHPSGEAAYTIAIELRNGKYRLILSDFVVTPYERDRYGNFVPISVKTALEKSPGKLNRSEWENNMNAIVTESNKIAAKLKVIMSNTQTEPKQEVKQPATVSRTEW
ncbi:hypothetical protein [Pedobacter steynii]